MALKPLAIAGAAIGSVGLSLGLGMTIANAASSPTTTTTPSNSSAPSTQQPSTTAPSQHTYGNGNCPNMGNDSRPAASAASNV